MMRLRRRDAERDATGGWHEYVTEKEAGES